MNYDGIQCTNGKSIYINKYAIAKMNEMKTETGKNGKVYMGCNIENHGIQGICGERTAFAKALSEGEREFESITVVGAPKGLEPHKECMPCGYCRQFMSEFVDSNFKIITIDENKIKEYTINEILPYSFKF